MTEQTQPTDAEILDAADDFRSQYKHGGTTFDEFNALGFARAVLAKWGTPAGAEGDRMADSTRRMIEGMSVSVDVSTGDHDAGRRYFGTVTEVMDCNGDKHGVTLLVQDAEPNFTPQPTQAQAGAVPLTDARILELAGLAPDRKVCASTCMTAKFEKKPCECYPTSASRSEVVAIARAIEVAHGIKGADHV